jgi:hypothetical protein
VSHTFKASDVLETHSDFLGSRYWAFKNAQSMDGLPGMKRGVETAKKENVKPIKKMVGPFAPSAENPQTRVAGQVPELYLVIVALLSFCMGIAATALTGLQLGYLRI